MYRRTRPRTLDALTGLGIQHHALTYDAENRLTNVADTSTAGNNGSVQYYYDGEGRRVLKAFSDGSELVYVYDALNRLQTVTHSDGTPGVQYSYNSLPYGVGRLTSMTTGPAATPVVIENILQYDRVGHVLSSNQQMGGQTYGFQYTWNLAGALTSETYPSGRKITTNFYDALHNQACF